MKNKGERIPTKLKAIKNLNQAANPARVLLKPLRCLALSTEMVLLNAGQTPKSDLNRKRKTAGFYSMTNLMVIRKYRPTEIKSKKKTKGRLVDTTQSETNMAEM